MFKPKFLLPFFFLVLIFAWISSSGVLNNSSISCTAASVKKHEISEKTISMLRKKAIEVKKFCALKGYNENICFLIDMSLPSGSNRFFVYNLKKDTLQNSGLVTHGRCNQEWLEGRKYGNTVGCGCTSLGKYRIGYPYFGKFGLAFKLHGLEKTNDKAFDRFVVLHGHDCVPGTETVDEICQSDGCPTVAPGFLQQLKPIINASPKPVLMWIYE